MIRVDAGWLRLPGRHSRARTKHVSHPTSWEMASNGSMQTPLTWLTLNKELARMHRLNGHQKTAGWGSSQRGYLCV